MKLTVDVDNTLLTIDNKKLDQEIEKIAKIVLRKSLQNFPKYHNTNPHFKSCRNIFEILHEKDGING